MKKRIFSVLSICVVLFMAAPLTQARSADFVVTHEWMLLHNDDLKYVYDAGYNIIYTMYIRTNSIIIASTLSNQIYQCRMVNVYSQNDKVVVNVGSGIMIMDDEKIEYGRAVYVRQKEDDGMTQLY
ncbi:exported hypothetical protein [Syntrophobacter sp. SbD1]|nr:exported hypothetical protein [Syntrophobacter sp. SbD1]